MAHVADLKIPRSSKSVVELKIVEHVRITLDICGKYGHAWNWMDKVPASIDSRGFSADPHLFRAPFRSGYSWACEREGCGQWMFVSQMDSERSVPTPFQDRPIYGSYGRYSYQKNSPFCKVNQARTQHSKTV